MIRMRSGTSSVSAVEVGKSERKIGGTRFFRFVATSSLTILVW